jgi:hypothetical protein
MSSAITRPSASTHRHTRDATDRREELVDMKARAFATGMEFGS